jgi:hypothetical protein
MILFIVSLLFWEGSVRVMEDYLFFGWCGCGVC